METDPENPYLMSTKSDTEKRRDFEMESLKIALEVNFKGKDFLHPKMNYVTRNRFWSAKVRYPFANSLCSWVSLKHFWFLETAPPETEYESRSRICFHLGMEVSKWKFFTSVCTLSIFRKIPHQYLMMHSSVAHFRVQNRFSRTNCFKILNVHKSDDETIASKRFGTLFTRIGSFLHFFSQQIFPFVSFEVWSSNNICTRTNSKCTLLCVIDKIVVLELFPSKKHRSITEATRVM